MESSQPVPRQQQPRGRPPKSTEEQWKDARARYMALYQVQSETTYNGQPNPIHKKETETLSQSSPMQKRGRGRPRKIFTEEQRKAAQAQYYWKRLEKKRFLPSQLNITRL